MNSDAAADSVADEGLRDFSRRLGCAAGFVPVGGSGRAYPQTFWLAYLGSQLGAHSMTWVRAHAWHLAAIGVALMAGLILIVWLAGRRRSQA